MRAIMLMFDTLNRNFLPNYGNDWVKAPNFERLGKRAATFDNCYAGSLPCMPARRDLQTGRLNFLHRAWGPMEPFDDSMPEVLKRNGVYTHLITDHYHYFEDGGCTYHTRYSSWEFVRGQEADTWKGMVADPYMDRAAIGHDEEAVWASELAGPWDSETMATGPAGPNDYLWRNFWVNRHQIKSDMQQPQTIAVDLAEEFIDVNCTQDNWFLQVELFDPHEPYFCDDKYKKLYPHAYDGNRFEWPTYERTDGVTDEQLKHLRYEYAALVSKCDESLGRILDMMDRYDLWRDTMLIVNTDHGFLLGEHGWIAKNRPPVYNEIARLPLFIWDPRERVRGERRSALVQMIDMASTLYDLFGVKQPKDVMGKNLRATIAGDLKVRTYALFGYHTGHMNVTDGRYVYMLAASDTDDTEIYNYTLMPTHVVSLFSIEELKTTKLAGPFTFTKGLQVMKIKAPGAVKGVKRVPHQTMLFDLAHDPAQTTPIKDSAVEETMTAAIYRLMCENDAPEELFVRFGLPEKPR